MTGISSAKRWLDPAMSFVVSLVFRIADMSRRRLLILLVLFAFLVSLVVSFTARATISVVGSNSVGVNATSATVNTPAGAVSGDVLIFAVSLRGDNSSYTCPSGYVFQSYTGVRLESFTAPSASYKSGTGSIPDLELAVFRHTVTEGSPTSFTFRGIVTCTNGSNDQGVDLTAKTVVGVTAYRGVDPVQPIDVMGGQGGGGTSVTAPTVTTTVNNTRVVSLFTIDNGGTLTAPAGTTQQWSNVSIQGSAATKNTLLAADYSHASAGATGTRTATAGTTGSWLAAQVALRPIPPATLTQTAYRWFSNVDTANFSFMTNNPTTGIDAIYAATNDTTHIYTTGYTAVNGNDWFIEKRKLSDGALETGFGSGGSVISNVSASDDRAWGIDQDTSHIYVVGQDATISSTNTQWRIEKRDKTTGALVSGFGSGGVVQLNPTTGLDTPKEVKVDDSYVYVAGFDNTGSGAWRIEKRDKTTGALVSGFGSGGVVLVDYAATANDEISSMVLDNNNLYVGGFDYASGTTANSRIRIEKRDKTTGALVSGFGSGGVVTENPFTGNSGSTVDDGVVHKGLVLNGSDLYIAASQGVTGSTDFQWRIAKRDSTTGALVSGFGNSGVINVDPGTAIDNPTTIESDGSALFVGGFDRTVDGGTGQWRIEKRDLTSGALVTNFGSGGVIVSNPSTGHDDLRDMVISNGNLYGVGYDSPSSDYRMRIEKRNTVNGNGPADGGIPKVASNTPATSVAINDQVRLRFLLRVGTSALGVGDQQFKLQFAEQSGTCDTGFSGEVYADVTTTTAIAYHNNAALTDASTAYFNVNDPTDGANPVVIQTYEEGNNFTNSTAAIPVNSNGLWDASLYNRSAPEGKTFCFRVVDSAGSVLGSYSQLPELSTPPLPEFEQANYRLYQNADSSTPGAPLGNQDTPASVPTETPFRIRQLLKQTVGSTASAVSFRLQAGEKVTSCSAASYEYLASGPVQTSTGIQYTSSSIVNIDDGSRYAWSNPSNAQQPDSSDASVTAGAINDFTDILRATGYGFQIPSDATVTGIELSYTGSGTQDTEQGFWIVKNNTVMTGDDRSIGPFTTRTEGSSTDLWSTTWTPADINSSGFGFALKGHVSYDSVSGKSGNINIDAMGINVYYTTAGSANALAGHDNASLTDGSAVVVSGNDPVPAIGAVVLQSYQEDDTFSSTSGMATGENGLWDFSLTGDSTTNGKTYCFRVVNGDGTQLGSYAYYPEVTFGSGGGPVGPTLNQQLRGGQSVIDGVKRGFLW